MKTGTARLISLFLLVVITLGFVPTSVMASNFEWNTGTSVTIDLQVNPAPSWLQLFSEGVKTTGAVQLCHPFQRGTSDWIGEIYQLKGGEWSKLPTTMSWIPNLEGHYAACAQAPEAGIYALFGYYSLKAVLEPLPALHLSGDWDTGTEVMLDMAKTPAPDWLQLLSKGIEVRAKTKICHPFPYGIHDWTAEIRQWKNGEWIKIPTTVAWSPNAEGNYTACATTAEAGTYALFGYYNLKAVLDPVPVLHLSGDWNTGSVVSIDWKMNPAPGWLQLLSVGIKVTGKTQICHPFRFGAYGWTAEIRQLKDGKWVKLATTATQPDIEGTYFACANAAESGTYALFGFVP